LHERNTSRETDLDSLSRLRALSWLSPSELTLLVGALVLTNYKRQAVILRDAALARDAHICGSIARITCRNARNERVTWRCSRRDRFPNFRRCRLAQSGFNARLTTIAA